MADNNATQENLQDTLIGFDGIMTAIGQTIGTLGGKYTDAAYAFSASFGVMNNVITGSISYNGSPQQLSDLEKALIGIEVGILAPAITVSVLTLAGASAPIVIIGAGATAIIAGIYGDEIYDQYTAAQKTFFKWMIDNNYDLKIANSVNSLWDEAQNWVSRIDPLVLDLDGDGIETIGVNSVTHVMFDSDGDGVKTGTGWVNGDDGLLVLDRNGNGIIDKRSVA